MKPIDGMVHGKITMEFTINNLFSVEEMAEPGFDAAARTRELVESEGILGLAEDRPRVTKIYLGEPYVHSDAS